MHISGQCLPGKDTAFVIQHSYFNQLNYSLANEDSCLEQAILPPNCRLVLTVAGSGARVLPLLSRTPAQVYVCDLASQQIYLSELRLAALQGLSYENFLSLLGYKSASRDTRQALFESIRARLSNHAATYCDELLRRVDERGILFAGRFERVLSGYGRFCRQVLRLPLTKLFNFEHLSEQIAFLDTDFPNWRWHLALASLGNAQAFNKLLYQGNFPEKNTKGSMFQYYRKAFDSIFRQDIARRNFFLQLTFLGALPYAEGYPAEAQPAIHIPAAQHARTGRIEFMQRDLLTVASDSCPHESIDFISLSDVPAYLDNHQALHYLQTLRPKMAKNGLIVVRDYLKIPLGIDSRGFEVITEDFRSLIAREKTQMYQVQVYRRI